LGKGNNYYHASVDEEPSKDSEKFICIQLLQWVTVGDVETYGAK